MQYRAPARTVRFTVGLRSSLREEHERLERRLGLPGSVADRADYSRLLNLWFTVWDNVAATTGPATPPGAELTTLAREALAALALDHGTREPPQTHETSFSLPADEASLWGAAYVLRGSSLGNQFLHPLILAQLGESSPASLNYLAGSGPDVRREWSAFCRRLDHWAEHATETDRDRAATSAADTFRLVGTVADALGWPTWAQARR